MEFESGLQSCDLSYRMTSVGGVDVTKEECERRCLMNYQCQGFRHLKEAIPGTQNCVGIVQACEATEEACLSSDWCG